MSLTTSCIVTKVTVFSLSHPIQSQISYFIFRCLVPLKFSVFAFFGQHFCIFSFSPVQREDKKKEQ